MKIHHYTSIETLEMILKNKSIKFNRLDQVDDKAEYKYDSTVYDTNIKLGKYTFVSCWTKSEMENIDLWNRYGKGNKGVRISLDEDMFETYDVGTVNRSFYNNREYCFENFVVSSYINKVGLVDVKYEQNIELYYKEAIKCFDQGVAFKHDNIGIYKKREWGLQNESRFIIHAQPFEPALMSNHPLSFPLALGTAYRDGMELSRTALYIPLKQKVLEHLEITMGPGTTDEDRKKVEKILKDCNIKAEIKDSALKGDL